MIYIPLALLIVSVAVALIASPRKVTAELLALWAIGAALILPHVWNR